MKVWGKSSAVLLVAALIVLQSSVTVVAQSCDCVLNGNTQWRCLCDGTGCGSRNWVSLDYLLLFPEGYNAPALVAESAAGTPRPQVGVLGDPATNILFGDDRIADGSLSGINLEWGHWLDDCGNRAIVGSFFGLSDDSEVSYPSNPNSIISRPFFNTNPAVNAFDAELVNFAGVVAGTISVSTDTDIYSGAVGLQRKLLCCADDNCCNARRLDLFYGYRGFRLDDNLTIDEALSSSATSGFLPPGTLFDVRDSFATENRFHGVELALSAAWQRRRWTLGGTSRVALGNVRQRLIVDGSTSVTVPGTAPAVQPYGILANPANIGTYERDRFGVLTQTQLEVGYWLTCRANLKVGYNFVFLNDTVRPGAHVPTTVNGTLIDPLLPDAGPATQTPEFVSESLILHGLNFGFEFIF